MRKFKVVPHPPLTKAEVADRLGVSDPTVQKLIKSGRLRAIRISETSIRVLWQDFEDFLAVNATAAPRKEQAQV
jgi:excisionase family DNA binding protein